MSKPSWLDEDADDTGGSSDDPFADRSSGGSGFMTPPPKSGTKAGTSPIMSSSSASNAFVVTPPPTEKPSDLPDFLRAVSPASANMTNGHGSPSGSPVAKKPPKKTKNGEVIDVDIGSTSTANAATTSVSAARGESAGTTNAPVHFLKRMQEAEQAKAERRERRKEREARDPAAAAEARKEKREKKGKSTTPRRAVAATSADSGSDGDEQQAQHQVAKATTSGKSMAEVIASGGIEDTTANIDLSVVPELSADAKEKYEDLIAMFGLDLTAKLLSPRWQHRLAAVQESAARATESVDAAMQRAWMNLCDVLLVGLTDAVIQVFVAAVELLETLLAHCTFLDEAAVVALQPVASALGTRLRESNTRIRDAAVKLFSSMSQHSCIGPVFALDIICGVEGSAAVSDSRSWVALITRMDAASAITKADESLIGSCKEILMRLCVQGLNCSNAKVRKRATTFATDIYRVIGKEMEPFLTAVSAATVRQLRQELEIEVCDATGPLEDETRKEDTDIAAFDAEEGSPMSEEQKVLAEIWADALGLRSAKCIFSSRWKLREQLVERLHRKVAEAIEARGTNAAGGGGSGALASSSSLGAVAASRGVLNFKDNAVLQSLAQVEEKALSDAVPAVVAVAIPLVKTTIPVVPPMHIVEFATPLVDALVRRHTQNPQTAMSATECIVLAAKHPKFGAATTCDIIMNDDAFAGGDVAKTAVKIVTSRLDLLANIVETFGFEEAGMSVDRIMKYAVGAFEHPQVKARASAANLIVEVYKQAGNVVQAYLSNLKGALLQELKDKINAIARKDRTRTAPIQRLANIVQPLGTATTLVGGVTSAGVGAGAGGPGGSSSGARPNTIGGAIESGDFGRESGASVRQRILQWHEMKKHEEQLEKQQQSSSGGGGGASQSARPNLVASATPNASAVAGGAASLRVGTKQAFGSMDPSSPSASPKGTGDDSASAASRPPRAPSKKRREQIMKLARGEVKNDSDFDDDDDDQTDESDASGDDSNGGRRMPLALPPGGDMARPSAPNKKSRLVFS